MRPFYVPKKRSGCFRLVCRLELFAGKTLVPRNLAVYTHRVATVATCLVDDDGSVARGKYHRAFATWFIPFASARVSVKGLAPA